MSGGGVPRVDDLTRQRLNRESQAFRDRLGGKIGWEAPSLYHDRTGKPIGLGDWTYLHADEGYVRVASTNIGEAWVSTVWLGLDHNFLPGGIPVIFETMIFGGPLDQWQDRYHDEAEALEGHLVACALVKAIPWWRTLRWIMVDSYRKARDARPGGGWPRWPEPEVTPLWKAGDG